MSNIRRFYKCNTCGNFVGLIHSGGGELVCCGNPMEEVKPNTVDASKEKHVPVITRDGNEITVTIGSVLHPMEEKHYIQWIAVAAGDLTIRKDLKPGDKPELKVTLDVPGKVSAYELCNIHGLWLADEA